VRLRPVRTRSHSTRRGASPLLAARGGADSSDRDPNEAYLTREGTEAYALYFPDGGTGTLDLTGAEGTYRVEWLDVEASEWTARRTVDGGPHVRLNAPGTGNWAVLVERQ
jgi:hypothetical protein